MRGKEYSNQWNSLRSERLNRGITQDDMARRLGHSCRNAYGMKELGKRCFTIDEALHISRILGTPVEVLFQRIG